LKPNILLFMGVCSEEGNVCMVTESMARGSVHDLLHPPKGSSGISFKRKLTWAKEAAQGMNWLHEVLFLII
jgi:hypothetical protein